MNPRGLAWLAVLACGAAFWWFVALALFSWSPATRSEGIGFVYVNAGSIELHDVTPSGESNQQICATVRPATSGYVFQQWGENKKYMYPTRVVGPVAAEREVCSLARDLPCDKTIYWRTFMIVDGRAVLGFDHFGEFVACAPAP